MYIKLYVWPMTGRPLRPITPYIWLLPNSPEANPPGLAKVRRLLIFHKRSRRAYGINPEGCLALLSRLLGLMFRTMSDGKSLCLVYTPPDPGLRPFLPPILATTSAQQQLPECSVKHVVKAKRRHRR
ncbi:hypothetical protein CGRA01v4_07564 [Colletotrichum graminicola]|nr:hypothetical protein CGRA01v4_07564 [Colletotrichum graminicola]